MKIISYYRKGIIVAKNKIEYSPDEISNIMDEGEEVEVKENELASNIIIEKAQEIKEANEDAEAIRLRLGKIGDEVIIKLKKLVQ